MNFILQTRGLHKNFRSGLFRRRTAHAVSGIDLRVRQGEVLGIVGESGCGKSTLAKMLVGLLRPSIGEILLAGQDLYSLSRQQRCRAIQYVFQDAAASLNPRYRVGKILTLPMRYLHGLSRLQAKQKTEQLMQAVNLRPDFVHRFPHEFSGGQAQRIGIARALAAEAKILVLDEPVSALDVSVQAQVLNLLSDLKARFDLTYIFISHNLSVVEHFSDKVAVMYFGKIVEYNSCKNLFNAPRHPYTRLLLDSIPVPHKKRLKASENKDELPDIYTPPVGCAFADRCPRVNDICRRQSPVLSGGGETSVACHFPLDEG